MHTLTANVTFVRFIYREGWTKETWRALSGYDRRKVLDRWVSGRLGTNSQVTESFIRSLCSIDGCETFVSYPRDTFCRECQAGIDAARGLTISGELPENGR